MRYSAGWGDEGGGQDKTTSSTTSLRSELAGAVDELDAWRLASPSSQSRRLLPREASSLTPERFAGESDGSLLGSSVS